MDESTNTEAGGFIPPISYPSPAPSHGSTSSTASNLPTPRSKPLRPGSSKEDAARRYVEGRLLHVSRRYTKKFQNSEDKEGERVRGEMRGYEGFGEVGKDIGEVVDVVWLSGTPSLQIPYLLNISGLVSSYIPAFPPSPKAMFALLRKLDHAFSSLLKGEDTSTGKILPGFEGGMKGGMSMTDMVRCKGIVEETRVVVVEVMGRDVEVEVETEGEDESMPDADTDVDREPAGFDMDVARVYENTIMILGELLVEDRFHAGNGGG